MWESKPIVPVNGYSSPLRFTLLHEWVDEYDFCLVIEGELLFLSHG